MNSWKRLFFYCSMLFWNVAVFAQDKDIDVNINSDRGGGFVSNNLIWLLLVVAVIVALVLGLSLRGSTHSHVEEPHHDHHHHSA